MNATTKILRNFGGDKLAADVFTTKYAIVDVETGEIIETSLDEMRDRLAKAIVEVEEPNKREYWEEEFRECLDYFIPAGRILYALGNPNDTTATLKNCYVIQIDDDSIDEIFETAKRQAILFSRGGGVGFDLSTLRPAGAPVNNSAKTTSGSVSFMDLYSMVTGIIGQYGRRGALMLTMDIKHPDVIEFIKIKGGNDKSKVQFANISIRISDEFMKAVKEDTDWEMSYTLKDGTEFKNVEKASIIWDLFVESNWKGAEPGIMFWDNIINDEPAGVFPETRAIATNPCGELPLENGASCCLGSLDLNKFVKNSFTDKVEFDYGKFCTVIRVASRFLDNINIINTDREPLDINREATRMSNKIGLGFTGLADTFIRMNAKYGSYESQEILSKIGYCLYTNTILESVELAKERGACGILQKYMPKEGEDTVSGYWDEWKNHKYFDLYKKDFHTGGDDLEKYGTRNIGFTTCAPSGSISIILRTSSGIEPIYMLSYDRTVHQAGKMGKKETYTVYHPLVEEYNILFGKNAHLNNENFITSADIDWKERIQLQSIIQGHISASISSTINLPKDTTKETISEIYKYAHHFKLKGVTIYRDGCREGVLNANEKDKRQWQILDDYKFPTVVDAELRKISAEGRKWLVTIPFDPETKLPNGLLVTTNSTETNILTEDVLEQLISLAKKHIKNGHLEKLMNNTHNQTNVVKIARVIGMLLRHRIPIVDIIKTIDMIEPPVYSFIFQIKKILAAYLPDGILTGEKCPDCDTMLVFEGGCKICKGCGWGACE